MGYGNGGYPVRGQVIALELESQGVETSVFAGRDTDILVFNMSSSVIVSANEDVAITQSPDTSVIVGVSEDVEISDPATPVIVGDQEELAGAHEVSTSIAVETP